MYLGVDQISALVDLLVKYYGVEEKECDGCETSLYVTDYGYTVYISCNGDDLIYDLSDGKKLPQCVKNAIKVEIDFDYDIIRLEENLKAGSNSIVDIDRFEVKCQHCDFEGVLYHDLFDVIKFGVNTEYLCPVCSNFELKIIQKKEKIHMDNKIPRQRLYQLKFQMNAKKKELALILENNPKEIETIKDLAVFIHYVETFENEILHCKNMNMERWGIPFKVEPGFGFSFDSKRNLKELIDAPNDKEWYFKGVWTYPTGSYYED